MGHFLIRSIPKSMHKDIEYFSRIRGLTMRMYILSAIKQRLERDKMDAGIPEEEVK